VFRALADPTRRRILLRLGSGDATVSELAAPFETSLPAVSRHLKVLAQAGLITRSVDAQWRVSSLRLDPVGDVEAWLLLLRSSWQARFDRLDSHLHRRDPVAVPAISPSPGTEGRP
jgi:DNA-binding transcriptional ArsR family regulator